VIVYSRNKLIHGDLVTKKEVRINIWLRMQPSPDYLHLVNTAVLFLGGGDPKSLKYNEYFFPVQRILGFHIAPPAEEPLDFDPEEVNRTMLGVNLILGSFILKGLIRVSSNSDLTTMLERTHTNWLSVYDADISNLFLPQMPAIHVSMLLVNPTQVSFGL
jgi:hypothetical protein